MIKRCAIYTRKSTEEGLDQAFNSLDAQREACDNYILSQKSEGWRAVKTHYDDGGLSGGNMERPALQALMQDIDDGKVDIIVVYKVDRLTRSLADFAKLVEKFDKHDVSFVSVTQQFNTSNSMGRLTLNVLLSFAQFEREVGAERVRDKIAASRKKGIWTGGKPPLGYDNIEKRLVVNKAEATIVREIFALYHRTQCVRTIIKTGAEKGWRTKRGKNGVGGKLLSRGPIYWILKNPIYTGLIKGGKKLYEGQQEAIIDREIWEKVQTHLAKRSQWSGSPKSKTSPLAGLLFWEGKRLTPSHSNRRGRKHRYYISDAKTNGVQGRVRLKADEIEATVVRAIMDWLSNSHQSVTAIAPNGHGANIVQNLVGQLEKQARILAVDPRIDTVAPSITRIDLSEDTISVTMRTKELIQGIENVDAIRDETTFQSTLSLKRRGQELRLILGNCETPRSPDETILTMLARAQRWKTQWFADPTAELKTILNEQFADSTTGHRTLRLAFLAPDIVEAFLRGTAPVEINSETLKRLSTLPADWEQQRAMLGMSDKAAKAA